jgi:hypothetical protein
MRTNRLVTNGDERFYVSEVDAEPLARQLNAYVNLLRDVRSYICHDEGCEGSLLDKRPPCTCGLRTLLSRIDSQEAGKGV